MPVSANPKAAREALARLYPPLAPALLAWANLRLSPTLRRAVQPEDLAQEVWLRACEAFDSFDASRTTFRCWLFAVSKRVLLEVQRKFLRLMNEQVGSGSSTRLLVLHEVPDAVTSLTHRVSKNEHVLEFTRRIGELDEKDRMTVIHCGLEELSLSEAAQRLGEAYATTAKRWQRLRDHLRGWAGEMDLLGEV